MNLFFSSFLHFIQEFCKIFFIKLNDIHNRNEGIFSLYKEMYYLNMNEEEIKKEYLEKIKRVKSRSRNFSTEKSRRKQRKAEKKNKAIHGRFEKLKTNRNLVK